METSFEPTADLFSEVAPAPALTSSAGARAVGDDVHKALSALTEALGQPFAVVDVESGDLLYSDYDCLVCDYYARVELLSAVVRHGKPEIVESVSPLAMLAVPLNTLGVGENLVAVSIFVDTQVANEQETVAAARTFGLDAGRAYRWTTHRTPWSLNALQRASSIALENLKLRSETTRLALEVGDAYAHAEEVCAELDLLHRLTGQLHLSESEEDLWRSALRWLGATVPAQCLAIVMRADAERPLPEDQSDAWTVLADGECPTTDADLVELIRRFGAKALGQPLLLNRAETVLPTWHVPTIRELVCVPIEANDHLSGWLLGLNHRGGPDAKFHEFGSVEIQLLSSVGTILGIHHSNLALYRDQAQLFSSSVQALTSAIDAKDRYTAGHSNRVAYLSVSLANQLGLSKADRDTLYLAGLLHDIGKIGIDDEVLNKDGGLTEEEYEQIKLHPQLGYEILKGVRQLDKVLPIVLHHHESWDGRGYPHGLAGQRIPRMARIMAVADAFDAMSSDRPYRKGMSDTRLDTILREGAGRQWDPEVIDAFFEIRDEIRRIVEASSACQSSLEQEDGLN